MSKYVSKIPDSNGNCSYTDEENNIWSILINRQLEIVKNRACQEYLDGLKLLEFPKDRVPQSSEINKKLLKLTGWQVQAVPAVIGPTEFYTLLANKKFPMATFIRTKEDLDYLQEPDVFHELFGHCPLLTNQAYADFLEFYGKTALKASKKERMRLFRLFWFTIEFGIIEYNGKKKIYGAGILSSKEESVYSVESDKPVYKKIDALECLRTPFRIDIIQPLYFTIEKLNDLYKIKELDLLSLTKKSLTMETRKALFSKEDYSDKEEKSHC